MAMFLLELDVTLAKIEDIPSNFIGWTSSVFVAFALSDLYFLVTWCFLDPERAGMGKGRGGEMVGWLQGSAVCLRAFGLSMSFA